ncbi:hypothetical protein M8J76_010528 [Diaphorina citri]|nr:hypothetical protein M8J76_010528 [Diaphorina citri]
MEEQRPLVKLTDVNPYILCVLCRGYIVDATSIAECLHSFCRSCIILHLAQEDYCPRCKVQINNSKPDMYLKPDKTLQDIIYKIVPGLFHSEMKRRREHYKKMPDRDLDLHPESRGHSVDRLIYSPDEKISLSLEFCDSEKEKELWDSRNELGSVASILNKNNSDSKSITESSDSTKTENCPPVIKSYLNCPAAMPLYLLKRFVRNKFGATDNDKVELIYRRESLPDYYSLMDVAYIYPWNRNEPMQFFFRIYVSSVKSNTSQPKLSVLKDLKLKTENVEKEEKPPVKVECPKPVTEMADEKNKENKVENKITIKTEEDSNVMKPLNAPVIKTEKESPVKFCGKENKAEVSNETNKIEALQKLTDNISTMVRDENKGTPAPQSFKTPSSSSLKDIGMLTTIPIAAKPAPTPSPSPSPSRPVSNCVRILPKPSPSSSSFTVPKSQVISVPTTMTRPTHLTIRSNLPIRSNLCSTQTASHLILSSPTITRPVPSQTPVMFTTVAMPSTPTPQCQSQVATAVSAYNNAIKQNNIFIRSNMLVTKPRQDYMQPINQTATVKSSTEDPKNGDKVNKTNEKGNTSKPLSRSEKVLKSAKYLNKVGGSMTGGNETSETNPQEGKKVNAMKDYIENPRILEELEMHAAETLLQVSRNCVPRENQISTDPTFKKPLPVLSPKSPKSTPLISNTITNVVPKITNVPPKIMPNGLSKNTLNRKIKDIKKTFESDNSKKPDFDPYDFDMSSSNMPTPKKASAMRTVYSKNTSSNKPNSRLQASTPNDRNASTGSPKLNSATTPIVNAKCDTEKPKDSLNVILSNGLPTPFLSNKRNDKQDLKRSFSETERCIETEDGMLSVSLMTHDRHLENKKRKVEEPDVSIQLMSMTPEETKKDGKDLLKRKIEINDQGSNINKKICFKPNGKSVEHISEMLKDKKANEKVVKTSPPSEKKSDNAILNGQPKTTKTLPKLIEINAAPFPKTPVTKTLNIKTQQSSLENDPKQELLTALDLSPSSKSPQGDNKPNSAPNSPKNSASPPRSSPTLVQSKSPKSDAKTSPPKKSSPNGTEFRSIPDLVRPEYFKFLQNRSLVVNNNNHLQDWYKAMSVGSIPPHPLMFNNVPTPSPESLSKT